ncbi:MAG TPA: glycosyltransferase family 2 protein [Candidatus Omnitrophota bacterium]|nr:glycosyltransferase family 2 protein [Candidatus Omnitrophota bacterium]HPD85568.1 glycosyltransferase family 2 protein [Candidatus Omnitrophota bacterium]HRZ04392.1 glycosyltransferase family 2 protein [Candidatus Omnitrophota bacterium]
MSKDVSIVIAAFNEEKNIEAAIDNVVQAVGSLPDDYEIVVVNDGSHDRTGALAEAKAKANPRINVIHHEANKGFGCAFSTGVRAATKSYVTGFPGDNDASAQSLKDIIGQIDNVDLIFTYMEDTRNRSLLRRMISKTFVLVMNCLFGLKLKYYNGLFICRRQAIQSVTIKSSGLTAIAECLVRMIKSGCTYKQVCFHHTGRKEGKSTALTLRSLRSVSKAIFILVKDIYFPEKDKAGK